MRDYISKFVKLSTLICVLFVGNSTLAATQIVSVNASGTVVNTNNTITLTNNINLSNNLTVGGTISGNGANITNTSVILDFKTNTFVGTSFILSNTNQVVLSNTNIFFINVVNSPTSGGRYGSITIIATGNITITNDVSMHFSDATNSRSITTGQSLELSMKVIAGTRTNTAIALFP